MATRVRLNEIGKAYIAMVEKQMESSRKPKEGDRVRLKSDHKATGTIDEIWTPDDTEIEMAAICWDISGCVGDGPLSDLELTP